MKGLNNAGVETFKGNFDRYLAREIIQNSLDARDDFNKPVVVKFSKDLIRRKDIPDIDALRDALERCREYWGAFDKKAQSFLERAIETVSSSKITALRAADFNTKGLTGGDRDPQEGWFHLVRCAGSSSKNAGEGGSFGIGKNAPFAASHIRTVLYSTKNKSGESIFAGVATLMSYLMHDGALAQDVWYLGGEGGASVRDAVHVPESFKRQEPGLDIAILGFPNEERWDVDLIYSVLENFWPAVQFGDLEVEVGETLINKATLPDWLSKFSEENEEFTAHLYFSAFSNPQHRFSETLPSLGPCDLYFTAGDLDLPKKVAMVRKAGMVVWPQGFRSIIPFCGVFLCRNDVGNQRLREMEPPKHDVWDPDHPEKGANRRIYKELGDFIRSKLRELAPVDPTQVISIPELSKYLPDDEESSETPFENDSTQTDEAFQPAQPVTVSPVRRLGLDRKIRQPDHHRPDEGNDITQMAGDDEAEGPSYHKGPPNNGPGNQEPFPGTAPGQSPADDQRATRGGISAKPAIPIKYRSFSSDPFSRVYRVNITSQLKRTSSGYLVFNVSGDDGREPANLKAARSAAHPDLGVTAGNIVGPIVLTPKAPVQFEVVLASPGRIAMEVQAYEA
jgi:hypothetical protein